MHAAQGGGAGAEKMSSRSNAKWVAQTSLLTVVLSVFLVAPAAAAGNAQLNRQIISNPISGFQQFSTQNLQSEVTYLDQLEKAGIGPHGGTATVAVNGWNDPFTKQGLAIFLAAFSYEHVQDQDQKLQASSGAAALALCVGASAPRP